MTIPSLRELPVARPPSRWADEQRRFASSTVFDDGPARTVRLLWWISPSTTIPTVGPFVLLRLPWFAVKAIVAAVRRVRWGAPGAFVIVVGSTGSSEGERCSLLAFEVAADALPSPSGSCEARLVGELQRNGALAVEVGGKWIVPIGHPRHPTAEQRRVAGRVGVDPCAAIPGAG